MISQTNFPEQEDMIHIEKTLEHKPKSVYLSDYFKIMFQLQMKSFLKSIRFTNLLMLALMQSILHFGFLKIQKLPLALNDWQFSLLILATMCIAGGGYLINNIIDQETDTINKPDNIVIGKTISETFAYNSYVALNILGVGIGFYLSNLIGKPMFSSISIIIAVTLYLYATSFKQSLLLGNFIVATLLSISILITGIYDLFPMITPETQPALATAFGILLDFAIFAFIINFIREIVKDLEDVKGDSETGMNTLPIAWGVSRTAKMVLTLSFLPISLLIYYTYRYFFNSQLYIASFYSMAFLIAPLIYFTVKSAFAKEQNDFAHLSKVLKFIILMGILSIIVVTLNIQYNA